MQTLAQCHRSQQIALFFLGALLSLVGSVAVAAQGDPIPGVDVSIEQTPQGIVAKFTTLPQKGFSVAGLQPGAKFNVLIGKQVLKLTVNKAGVLAWTPPLNPPASSNYNSSKSN